MRLGLDIDETITRYPMVYAALVDAVLGDALSEGKVFIITGRGEKEARRKQLLALGFSWTDIVIVNDGSAGPAELAVLKVKACQDLKIDVMIDDMPEIVAACNAAGILGLLSPK